MNAYQCTCVGGYSGKECNVDINECASNPCTNGGQCVDHINAYSCSCRPGFTGINCETNIDDCQPNPCRNNGTRFIIVHSYITVYETLYYFLSKE